MIVEQNRKAGQNPPRFVAPTEEEEEEFVHTPHFCKRDLVPSDFNSCIALLYIFSDKGNQLEDGLTRTGRNMHLAETFVYTLTLCILQI